jgi:hypothetical protein
MATFTATAAAQSAPTVDFNTAPPPAPSVSTTPAAPAAPAPAAANQ